MKKLLIVCGSGGHTAQALILYKDLSKKFDCSFLVEESDPLIAKKLGNVPVYTAIAVRGKKELSIQTAARLLLCFFQSFFILVKAKPQVIVSTGPGLAVPISIMGRLFGKKVIFIESWSRVTTRSWAGKIIYHFANQFFVQWPEMKEKYPKAVYAGRLG